MSHFFFKGIFVLLASVWLAAGFPFPVQASEQNLTSVRLDAATLRRGFTVQTEDRNFLLGLRPGVTEQPLVVRLQPFTDSLPLPSDLTLVSDIWQYDIVSPSGGESMQLLNPVSLAVRFSSTTLNRKQLFYWDGNRHDWLPLPSARRNGEPFVQGHFVLPYAQIAVFDNPQAVEGEASWFRYRLSDAVANNDFPMGSRVRVMDLLNGKFVDLKVRSRGPFVAGRVADLASASFSVLRPLWQGVTRVRVELLTSL